VSLLYQDLIVSYLASLGLKTVLICSTLIAGNPFGRSNTT